jgi:eukaryotic-like serine/threonine-protein kinase
MSLDRNADNDLQDPIRVIPFPDPPGYQLIKLLGQGKTSIVFQAQSLETGEIVAIKFLQIVSPQDLFHCEYEILSKFNHPGIVRVFQYNDLASPPYLVMEFLQGARLDEYCSAFPDNRLPLKVGIPLFLKFTDALICLHNQGLIHQDLKPSSLMVIDSQGNPEIKLVDFGLACSDDTLPPKGKFYGSIYYGAPEQFLGSSTALTPLVDLYSLGVTLYETFTGVYPFEIQGFEAMKEQHLHVVPRPPSMIIPDLPPALETLILSLMAKEPGKRPANAETVQFFLNSLTAPYQLTGEQEIHSSMQIQPGIILNRRYRVENKLEQCGDSTVFQARDAVMERNVAIKVIKDVSFSALEQVQKEVEILAGLNHPNLPRVRAYFTEADMQCVVMDFIPGINLAKVLDLAINQSGKPIPENDLMVWVDQICNALQYMHRQTHPIIHRNIKSENIIIGENNRAYLVNFGLGKINRVKQASTAAIGFSFRHAPLERHGRIADDANIPSDVFALGATIYQMLTGNRPSGIFSGQKGKDPPLSPARDINPEISPEVSNALSIAMHPNPKRRYRSIVAFRAALVGQPQQPPFIRRLFRFLSFK